MKRNLRRNLLLATALAAVIAGIVLAVAPGGHHQRARHNADTARPSPPGDIQLAARYLGFSRAELRRLMRSGKSLAEVANATPGHSAAGLEQALLAPRQPPTATHKGSAQEQAERAKRLRRRISEEVGRRRRGLADIAIAATYLGLTEAALRAKLRQGHSIASIAGSKAGTSRAGLIALIIKTRSRRLEQAMAARIITAKQERSAITRLKRRTTREVDRTLRAG
jgi:hypothetical protein